LFINTPQAAEVMLYTVDKVNSLGVLPPPLKLGAYVLDDCDKDTYGLQQAVDFIKGKKMLFLSLLIFLVIRVVPFLTATIR
jgi:hypothetical protein